MNGRRASGLDLLRLLAMAVIVLQHGISIVGHYDWTQLTRDGITFGQFGVGIFCALSGWFALSGDGGLWHWLAARLARLYPAYWLATLFAFALALATARPVTPWLFVSQMAGTGFMTHGWDLVNGPSWFVSLILLCYFLTVVARLSGHPVLAMSMICGVATLYVLFEIEIPLSRHVITFAAAALAGGSRRPWLLLLVAAMLAPLLPMQSSLIFAAVALPVFWLFREKVAVESPLIALLAGNCYEFFLLHGIFLNGVARLTSSPLWVIVLGTLVTVPAAFLLKRLAALGHIRLRAVQ
jgi:peptidoglycan/LPS O-acetylase OafA/YrhL